MKIHQHLKGKTIEAALTNGEDLILRLTTGEEVYITFDENGPVFKKQDVRIVLPPAFIKAAVSSF